MSRILAPWLHGEGRPLAQPSRGFVLDLDWVAQELNDRPRKRLGFKKPIEQIGPLLLQ